MDGDEHSDRLRCCSNLHAEMHHEVPGLGGLVRHCYSGKRIYWSFFTTHVFLLSTDIRTFIHTYIHPFILINPSPYQIFFYLFATMTTISSWYGLGRHISTFTFPEMPAYFSAGKFEAIAVTMCVLGSATSKTTVACFLLRIVLKRRHKVVLWLCLLTLWIDVVIVVVMLWLSCRPVQRIWDPLVRGKCPIDATTLQIAGACEFDLSNLWFPVCESSDGRC